MSAWPTQGVHHGVPFDVYRACDMSNADTLETCRNKSVSKSLIVDFLKDAAMWRNKPRKVTTAAMRAGSLFDCLLSDPASFDDRYTLSKFKQFKSNEAKAWRAEMEANGTEIIKPDQLATAQAQMAAIYAKPEAAALLDGAQFQVAFRHKTKHPFWSKGLIDVLPAEPGVLVDIKTCAPQFLESKRALQRHMMEFSYHVQAGCYAEGYSFAADDDRHRFKFIFVGSGAPYTVAVVELPLAAILYGAKLYRDGVNKLGECLADDAWRSMWDGEVELDLPEYAYLDGGAE